MGLGRQADLQAKLPLSWEELPRSQGHPFYDKLQEPPRGACFRSVCREALRTLLFGQGPVVSLTTAESAFPHAAGRLLRGHRKRARDRVALGRQTEPA